MNICPNPQLIAHRKKTIFIFLMFFLIHDPLVSPKVRSRLIGSFTYTKSIRPFFSSESAYIYVIRPQVVYYTQVFVTTDEASSKIKTKPIRVQSTHSRSTYCCVNCTATASVVTSLTIHASSAAGLTSTIAGETATCPA